MPVYIIRTDAYIEVEAESKNAALVLACEAPHNKWELGEDWTVTVVWRGEE